MSSWAAPLWHCGESMCSYALSMLVYFIHLLLFLSSVYLIDGGEWVSMSHIVYNVYASMVLGYVTRCKEKHKYTSR